ncbi:hypothetical protein TTHERM_00051850 (macronuclear) [Tetrahymena thermophila SB210]|uniref:Uncharacterized protein n=1 Tax=Tetrahymena thermophila (strain SB210) TaxID=312017 RepID=Q23D04_TETTS|nr:hypothetical protein TTHERM_00051850 [Tetrahymena thermophila SB210]EAR94642.1 hypothetical protein TTHERM_00051850 [Tetrahymena thermophila SB210]|eukprot:XP_001014882.1 hypothetical protein TTHERM_00051850 [Tetrahymena thermophila SB210]
MVKTIEQSITDFNEKISITKHKSLSQINNLQRFLQQQLEDLTEKIVNKIDKYDKQIQQNINFYHSLPQQNLLKGYFENILLSQLNEDLDILEVEDSQEQQALPPIQQVTDQQQSSHQKQLKEVYSILKKAINLFSEQYSNSIQNINNKLIDFSQKNIDFYSDYCLSQDRQHSNILFQKSTTEINNQENSLQNEQKNIQIEIFSQIDFKNESPSHLPEQYHYSHVKCFSILDDNRRAVLCTRNNLLLIDILSSKVLKCSYIRGDQPTLPTCIQPLYSYEYENEILYSEMFKSSTDATYFQSVQQDLQNNLFTINGTQQNSGESSAIQSENNQNQSIKRKRQQNLIAVGMGSLSSTIDICIYSLKNLQKIIRLPGHLRTICKIIQTPLDYETMFSISSDKKIIAWNLTNSNQILTENTNHAQSINDALMLNEYLLATFSLNGEIFLWDIEYTNQTPNKFKSLKKKIIIQRSCLSLYIGQVLMNSDRVYLSITSQGLTEQKYFLEMNDFQNRVLVKQELPLKVIGLNVLSVNMHIYAFVTYSYSSFFEVYLIDTCQSGQKSATLVQQIDFPSKNQNINTVIESPRVQFIQLSEQQNKILIAFALDKNISIYSITIS